MRLALLLSCVLAFPAHAANYFVATTGNDTTGDGSIGNPYATIEKGITEADSGSGDRVYIRTGTYAESINSQDYTIVGGSSDATRLYIGPYNGEAVTLAPSGDDFAIWFERATASYITVYGLIIDCADTVVGCVKFTHTTPATNASTHIRLQDSHVKNSPDQGILLAGESGTGRYSTHHEILRNRVYDNGVTGNLDHGIYVTADDNLIEGNLVYSNFASGIIVYGLTGGIDRNIVRGNRSYDNGDDGNPGNDGDYGDGILIGTGEDNIAYDNWVYGNDFGIRIYSESGANAVDTIVTGNCSWHNRRSEITEGGPGTPSGTVMTPNRLGPCPEGAGLSVRGGALR